MPKLKTARTKRAPKGFEEISDTLAEFENRLKEGTYFEFVYRCDNCLAGQSNRIVCSVFLVHFPAILPRSTYRRLNCETLSTGIWGQRLHKEPLRTALTPAELKDPSGKSKHESLHEVFQIHHQRSRYVYDLYYKKKAISNDLYQWLLKNRYGDANLIAKWKKQGYENLCCIRCIQTKENIHGAACICRVPKSELKDSKPVECITCGCRGCASTD